jgi:hypothetical protein
VNSVPVLLVSGGVHKHVEAVLHPVEGVQKVVDRALVDAKCSTHNRKDVAEKVAEADDADSGGHALVAGRQLGCSNSPN